MNELGTVLPLPGRPAKPCPRPDKKVHQTLAGADAFAKEIHSLHGGVLQRAYECACGKFHLSTKDVENFSDINLPTRPPDPSRDTPGITDDEIEENIRHFAEQGLSIDEIVMKTGEPHSTVHLYLSRIGAQQQTKLAPPKSTLLFGQKRKNVEDVLAAKRAALEEKKLALLAEEQRLAEEEAKAAEEAKLRIFWVPDEDINLLRVWHRGRSTAFDLETWREAVKLIAEEIRKVDEKELLLPGDEVLDESVRA